jgi:hypothetical protein
MTKRFNDAAARPTTTNAPWWIWRGVQTRLIKWTHLILGGRKYTVELDPETETGFHSPDRKLISVNPEMFNKEKPETQLRCTQGLLFHEVGHARFTGCWPEQKDDILCNLVNILEDERMERCMSILFPGGTPALRLLGQLCYHQTKIDRADSDPRTAAITAALAWRWAHRFSTEKDMFAKMKMTAATQASWAKIKDLVEQSWQAPDTQTVIEIAVEILRILGLPKNSPELPESLKKLFGKDIPLERGRGASAAEATPTSIAEDSPGLDSLPEEEIDHRSGFGKSVTKPVSYIDLENKAKPIAQQIIDILKEVQPFIKTLADANSGRFKFRLEQRDYTRPFARRILPNRQPRSLALYVLVDWSSSMDYSAGDVRLALMALNLACAAVHIPHEITFFGADRDAAPVDQIEIIKRFDEHGDWPKALLAGYSPSAGNEFLFRGLDKAMDELERRPERDRVILIIHDGQPVWRGPEGSDWDLSLQRLAAAERLGLKPIGIYMGTSDSDAERIAKLFKNLVTTDSKHLAEKLGHMLVSLGG